MYQNLPKEEIKYISRNVKIYKEVWEELYKIKEKENCQMDELIDDLLREALINRMCLPI